MIPLTKEQKESYEKAKTATFAKKINTKINTPMMTVK